MTPDRPKSDLPQLRPELRLLEGARGAAGEPTWLIHDPIQNRFTQIDATAYEALRIWHECRSIDELVARSDAEGMIRVDKRSIEGLIDFLYINQLTIEPRAAGWRYFVQRRDASRQSWAGRILHNYLFFRIPLVRPQALLERSLGAARLLATSPVRLAIVVMGLVGLYLASRQWEVFVTSFVGFFTWEGLALFALALILVKTLHELGHAYVTVHFGCRVHSMGIAFILAAPMPYTDVTDAWRLTDRRQRLLIDSAGILVELAVAAVALLLWSFLPDGALRDAAFVLSVVSLASSLAINLNPFMRFDGYYLLSELSGIENLQSRAFEVGLWKMRNLLFGLRAPCPEDLQRRTIVFLIAYAWAVWVYRLVLFVGIALVVYHFFFKALGIVLFVVEIWWFVTRPIAAELTLWYRMRSLILPTRRTKVTAACGLILVTTSLVPWSSQVEIPAVMESAQLQLVHATRPGRIVKRHVEFGALVNRGDPIVTLDAPEIQQELARTRTSLALARLQHARRAADAVDRESSLVLESAIEALLAKIEALEKESAELVVAAPFDGRIVELRPDIHEGRWLSPRELICIVAEHTTAIAKGYVAENDLWRITEGIRGTFVPEYPQRPSSPVTIERIAGGGSTNLEIAELQSVHSGRIAVFMDERRRAVPTTAQYLVQMAVDGPVGDDLSYRGVVLARGRAESLAGRFWRQTARVLLRESGF